MYMVNHLTVAALKEIKICVFKFCERHAEYGIALCKI